MKITKEELQQIIKEELEAVLKEEEKLSPTRMTQPEGCDVFVAPHAGRPDCDVELVEDIS